MLLKDKLKSLREDHDLLQRQVASAIGIDNAVYCKIENGERIARVEHVKALAVFYGIDFDFVVHSYSVLMPYSVRLSDTILKTSLGSSS